MGRPHPAGGRQIADSIRVVHPEGAHREAAGSQILFVLCIQKAPKGGLQIADSIPVVHPEGAQREAAESQILFVLCMQKKWNSESVGRPAGRPAQGASYN